LSHRYQVVILAAGKGVRFRSKTPKLLHRVSGLTVLERVIRAAAGIEPSHVTVVVGSEAEAIEVELKQLAGKYALSISTALQASQKGTGDAVRAALPEIQEHPERVLILYGDIPLLRTETLKEIIALDFGAGHPDLAVVSCVPPSPFGYGRIVRGAAGDLQKIVEQKDSTPEEAKITEINSGLYCGAPAFIGEAVKSFTPNNAQGELYFTDAIAYGVKSSKNVAAICVSNWLDLAGANTRAELADLETEARKRINRRVMEGGATLENPLNTYIDEDVEVGADVFLGAGSRLYGKTLIADNVRVDGDALIVDSMVRNGTHIKLGSVIEESQIGQKCVIGPCAHLRPKSQLADEVHIGNFVETKASKLGKGTKANHLTYIGDAVVGEKVNFGAGTITANYDGYNKHQTTIGSGASTGSNSVLVAPVTIGPGAYIGAGTVVTRPVPEDALAVERGPMTVVEDWARKRREKFEKEKGLKGKG